MVQKQIDITVYSITIVIKDLINTITSLFSLYNDSKIKIIENDDNDKFSDLLTKILNVLRRMISCLSNDSPSHSSFKGKS
jgi:hypothetical protein